MEFEVLDLRFEITRGESRVKAVLKVKRADVLSGTLASDTKWKVMQPVHRVSLGS